MLKQKVRIVLLIAAFLAVLPCATSVLAQSKYRIQQGVPYRADAGGDLIVALGIPGGKTAASARHRLV